jgi:predicted RNA-binding Zn-ribbon protein involved in translation (DUF1610 family)
MDVTEIRYHPLIDGDTEGIEKVPLFLSTDRKTISNHHSMFLMEMIPNYFRLYSNEPLSHRTSDTYNIHCPKCGSNLRQIADNCNTLKLGLYTCDRCKLSE